MDAGTLFYVIIQLLYSLSFFVLLYFLIQPVNWVDIFRSIQNQAAGLSLYCFVLPGPREPLETMHTTFLAIGKMNYPKKKFRVVAIPNASDEQTIGYLFDLAKEFAFLEVLPPATDNSRWQDVWDAWERNPGATWWHTGPHKGEQLPPKKTRQIIYAFYRSSRSLAKSLTSIKAKSTSTTSMQTARRKKIISRLYGRMSYRNMMCFKAPICRKPVTNTAS